MSKNVKGHSRTVGTQSESGFGSNVQDEGASGGSSKRFFSIGSHFSNLCKKSAYRNLLQRSITVDAQGKVNVTLEFIKNGRSRGTQTMLENESRIWEDEFGRKLRVRREESVEVAIPMQWKSPEISLNPSLEVLDESRFKLNNEDLPGTSKGYGNPYRSASVTQQMEDRRISVEGSRAVGLSCDRPSYASRVSNLAYLYENQGPKRQSDEAVLLIQDYQSYDYLNTARRQDSFTPIIQSHRWKFFSKKKRTQKESLTRPIPIIPESSPVSHYVCRICHEGEEIEPLIRPCLCKGSVGYIHGKCLKVWLEQSNTSRCEICGYPYAIRQRKKYTKLVSISVFLRNVVDRRAMMYDLISFVAVTPLCVVGIAMCIRASIVSAPGPGSGANFQMGNVTRAGMIMLSSTIGIAYGVWLYTLLSYHYKSWKRWYNSCYDVEVIPVCMSSEERLEALRRMEELRRGRLDQGGSLVTVIQAPSDYPYDSFFQRRVQMSGRVQSLPQ